MILKILKAGKLSPFDFMKEPGMKENTSRRLALTRLIGIQRTQGDGTKIHILPNGD